MRLAQRLSVISLAIVVTAGIAGVAVVANADERPASQAVSAPGAAGVSDVTVEEEVQAGTGIPDPAVLNDLLSAQVAAMAVAENTTTGVQTLAGQGALPWICSKRPAMTPLRAMVINSYCYWAGLGFPKNRVTKKFKSGIYWVGGGVFQNKQKKLPRGGNHHYLEFDLTPQGNGVARNAMRIVIDIKSGLKYYTLDHYKTFTEFTAG